MTSAALALRSVALEATLVLALDAGDHEVRITVEGDYDLVRPNAPRLRTYAGEEEAIVEALEGLIGQPLHDLSVAATGDLSLGWDAKQGRFRLDVPPALSLAAWQIDWGAPDGRVTRCLPGGDTLGPLP